MQALRTRFQRVPRHFNFVIQTTSARKFSHTSPAMSLFPRFTQEFAPIFRLFDEYDRQAFRGIDQQFNNIRSFTPKFDVKETNESYELHGELPGVEQKNINIEWTDNNTLTISGRHEHVREEGERPQTIEYGGTSEQKKLEHQPTVEDEATDTNTKTNKDSQVTKLSERQEVANPGDASKAKYWVSERSVGEFHRSFAFPARVDQDAVKASLKNGILNIVVPKATAPQARKINIE